MPPVRSVVGDTDLIRLIDRTGTHELVAVAIPPQFNSISLIENYVNTVWIPANITDYQAAIHVISLNPLRVNIGTWDLGTTIPANWWTIGG